MRLLLDTHIFLWYITGDQRLSNHFRESIENADVVFVSVVSIWEAVIKYTLGKLPLPEAPFPWLATVVIAAAAILDTRLELVLQRSTNSHIPQAFFTSRAAPSRQSSGINILDAHGRGRRVAGCLSDLSCRS
jgi:PIN domain nuclease of toxin-antitoxin system